MNSMVRNILAVVAGGVVGMFVNMGIIMISGSVVPPPEGVDTSNMESINANIHLYQPKHFIMPFLAHALGTLAGAFIAALLAVSNQIRLGITIGVFFLIGGVAASIMISGPPWFAVLDIIVAYIPMGWLGAKLAMNISKR